MSEKYQQKFLLQHRNGDGHLIKKETFSESITPEETLRKFGPGYYVLKSTKPRFRTVWKKNLGSSEPSDVLRKLKRRTNMITGGLIAVAATEGFGFWSTHRRFCHLEERVDKMEAIFQSKSPDLNCGHCGKSLDYYLQKFCSQCAAAVDWPRKDLLPPARGSTECSGCQLPVLPHQIYCPNCGRPRPDLYRVA